MKMHCWFQGYTGLLVQEYTQWHSLVTPCSTPHPSESSWRTLNSMGGLFSIRGNSPKLEMVPKMEICKRPKAFVLSQAGCTLQVNLCRDSSNSCRILIIGVTLSSSKSSPKSDLTMQRFGAFCSDDRKLRKKISVPRPTGKCPWIFCVEPSLSFRQGTI